MDTEKTKSKTPKQQSVRQLLVQIAIILIFAAGVLILLYPFYIDALNNYLDVQHMEKTLIENQDQFEASKALMEEKNAEIEKENLQITSDPFEDTTLTQQKESYYEEHLIGTVNIPKLKLEIPLYDQTSSDLLDRGATVLQGTSFPIGGNSTHSVISAHSGLPNRELFTNLSKLELGDTFLLDVLGETLAYQVFDIIVVEPSETDVLAIVSDEDLVSLLTCTPYMINSHRLIVTGERVPYTPKLEAERVQANDQRNWKQLGILILMIILFLLLIFQIYLSVKQYGIRKKRISLEIILDRPGITLILYNTKGKKPLFRDGKVYKIKTDENGQASFVDLPGNVYTIMTNRGWLAKMGIKNKQEKPRVYKLNSKYIYEEADSYHHFKSNDDK